MPVAVQLDSLPIPEVTPTRLTSTVLTPSASTPSFVLDAKNKSYRHQYANIYFARLRVLRTIVEQRASARWAGVSGNPVLVPRVLEVVKSKLCYIVGTVYMDMPLKPNILEDIARDRSIPPPPPRTKIYSPSDGMTLEDESGRIRLVGERVRNASLVTGVIVAALGVETPNGDFDVADFCFAGMAPQPTTETIPDTDTKMDVDDSSDEWIAVVSGFQIGVPSPSDVQIQMLVEYLTGEEGGPNDQSLASQVSRLVIAGNSLTTVTDNEPAFEQKRARKYGYDAASFSPHPMNNLISHLLDICRVMPVHVLPGVTDPAGSILPQQPFPRPMFGAVASFTTFSCETNPTYLRLGCGSEGQSTTIPKPHSRPHVERMLLINSGQPLNDMFRYVPNARGTRLSLIESTLQWRHMAPTAPDTLWCHPYFATDPFLIHETPDIYIVGGQKTFATRLVEEEDGCERRKCRIVLVPEFAESGVMVLVNMRTLDVKTVKFAVQGLTG